MQPMHIWLDCATAVLQRASSGVELENQTDCAEELEDVLAQETHFTAGLEEQRSLHPILADFMDAGVMSELGESLDAMQLRKAEVKQQLDAYRELLQRCVIRKILMNTQYVLVIGWSKRICY